MEALAVIAGIFGAASGFALSRGLLAKRDERIRRELVRAGQGRSKASDAAGCLSTGVALRVLGYMCRRSRSVESGQRPEGVLRLRQGGYKQFCETVGKTGLASRVSQAGFADARIRLSLSAGVCGAFVGLLFSSELAVLLGAASLGLGWRLPLWALRQERSARTFDMELHLSEMIEVVALGLRSGLSFDMSFALYYLHFDTGFAQECRSTQKRWSLGLASREAALRDLAATYDSLLFARVVENIIRSIRFGSSLAESLEASAGEARAIHKASMEEKVAKAPVKMLVPTATLILPAMLLLVLGPILLELMQGF